MGKTRAEIQDEGRALLTKRKVLTTPVAAGVETSRNGPREPKPCYFFFLREPLMLIVNRQRKKVDLTWVTDYFQPDAPEPSQVISARCACMFANLCLRFL